MNIKALIQYHSVASYFVLAYVISWGGCFATAGPKFLRGETLQFIGYAFPRMELKHSAFATSIYLGLLWTVWHVVADYLGSSGALGVYWLPHFLVWMIVTMTAMRVLIVWVYTNTRSVLLAQLIHASSTGFLSILVPSLSPRNDLLFYGVYAAILWLVVVIIVARYGKGFVRQPMSAKAS